MKFIRKLGIISLIAMTMFTTINVSDVHSVGLGSMNVLNSDENNPILEVYQSGNMIKSEWAIPHMIPENVIYETGFEEGDVLPNLIYGSRDKAGGRSGGQSISTESPHSGERSLRIEDTYTNGQQYGNPINGEYQYSNESRARFTDKTYGIEKGVDLSMSIRVKSTAPAQIRPRAQGVNGDYGITAKEKFTEDVQVGDITVKVDDITRFKSAVDNGRRIYLANSKGKYTQTYVKDYNSEYSTITVSVPFNYNFKAGDNVIDRRYITPLSFPDRTINSSEWTTINMNTKVPSWDYFDIKNNGFSFILYNSTRGVMYVDDFKMGHATEVQLHRDGKQVYKGKLSDYEDRDVVDNVKPDEVEDYNINIKDNKQYISIVEPNDNGNHYSYQAKAVSSDGSGEYLSDIKNIEYKSGIAGYSYVIDKNSNTNPDGVINSTNGEIQVNDNIYKDHYLHIQTVDGSGNKSAASHIKLDEVEDIINPSLNLTHSPEEWTNDSVIIHADATDNQSGIKEIFVVGEEMIRNGNFANGIDEWEFVHPSSSSIVIDDGEATFHARGIPDLRNVSLVQNNVLRDGLRNDFRINLKAKGNGQLNVRFRIINTGLPPANNPVSVNTDTFEDHVFYVPYDKDYADGIVIELLGDGDLIVSDIEMYETSEVNDGEIAVHENGVYQFSAVDNAGNVETKSIEITNIDKKAPSLNITPNKTEKTHEDITLNVRASDEDSGVKRIAYTDESMKEYDITGAKEMKATKNGVYTFIVEDNAGNTSTESFSVNNIVRELRLEGPQMRKNITVELQENMNVEVPIGNIKITDWRDENNDWKLLLQATQLNNGSHMLPEGSLEISGVNNISKLDGNKSGKLNALHDYTIIDAGPVEIIGASNERGVYDVNFKDDALKFNLTHDVMKGIYKTKLTWKLESTPKIN